MTSLDDGIRPSAADFAARMRELEGPHAAEAESLLREAGQLVIIGDTDRARELASKALALPYDDYNQRRPAVWAAHFGIFSAIASDLEACEDDEWLDRVERLAATTTEHAAAELRACVRLIAHDYRLEGAEAARAEKFVGDRQTRPIVKVNAFVNVSENELPDAIASVAALTILHTASIEALGSQALELQARGTATLGSAAGGSPAFGIDESAGSPENSPGALAIKACLNLASKAVRKIAAGDLAGAQRCIARALEFPYDHQEQMRPGVYFMRLELQSALGGHARHSEHGHLAWLNRVEAMLAESTPAMAHEIRACLGDLLTDGIEFSAAEKKRIRKLSTGLTFESEAFPGIAEADLPAAIVQMLQLVVDLQQSVSVCQDCGIDHA